MGYEPSTTIYIKLCRSGAMLFGKRGKRKEDRGSRRPLSDGREPLSEDRGPLSVLPKGKERESDKIDLNRDLRFLGLPVSEVEVACGTKLIVLLSLICLIVMDIFALVPVFDRNMVENGIEYDLLDKNDDGINDIVQDVRPIEDITYNSLGIETGRETIGFYGETNYLRIFTLVICPTAFLPFLAYTFFKNYPGALARRTRLRTLAGGPRAVSYLSMNLRMSPSLERAVEYSGSNLNGPMARSLKQMLWDVHMRTHGTIGSAYLEFADEWGKLNESFKRSMYLLYSSLNDKSDEDRKQTIEKANSVILNGIKMDMKDFSNSLKGPTMLMFAMGIVLPIIIITILPVLGVGMESLWWIIALMLILLPSGCFLFARRILYSRPNFSYDDGFSDQPSAAVLGVAEPVSEQRIIRFFSKFLLPLTLLAVCCLFAVLIIVLRNELIENRIVPLIFLTGTSVLAGAYLYFPIRPALKTYDHFRKLESELPDALYRLGMRVGSGQPLERAFEKTGSVMRGSEISGLFIRLVQYTNLTRSSLLKTISAGENDSISMPDSIRATMKVVIQSVEKNSSGAGDIIIDISNYLRDLRDLEVSLRQKLKEVIGTIDQTGIFFAPLIIGLTTSMYFKLNENLAGLDIGNISGLLGQSSGDAIPPEIFILIFGIYLLLMICIITYFVSTMEHGKNTVMFRKKLAYGLVVGSSIFAVSCLMGMQVFS